MRITRADAESFRLPRWEELPRLLLYMDQVILVLEESLALFAEEKERVVTSTMINNYVKQKVILPPVQKKYGREQLAQLMVVCLLKKVLSIGEIAALMELMNACHKPAAAYDSFCDALESALRRAFVEEERAVSAIVTGDAALVAQSAALAALMGKLIVEDMLFAAALEKAAKKHVPAKKPEPQKKAAPARKPAAGGANQPDSAE